MRGRQWTPEEDDRLRRLRAEGWSYAAIAGVMRRSKAGIAHRATNLGLPRPRLRTSVPRRMAPVPQTTTPTGLTRGSVPPTRLHEWRELRNEPVTRAEWRQRIVEGARRRREATA